ncbi:hypothetical protein F5Y19DRAFT_376974 [Xylariaceae sp. FL1651]|nr:hypothetical protein F5Y19DRAFT_376974 [Xylariaceae sp. FL1651]
MLHLSTFSLSYSVAQSHTSCFCFTKTRILGTASHSNVRSQKSELNIGLARSRRPDSIVIMSIPAWASKARSMKDYENDEAQKVINIFERLLTKDLAPEQAAADINTVLEPVMRTNRSDLRIISPFLILSNAVRELGSDREVSGRLVSLLESLRMIQAKDESGNDLSYEWGGKLWTDLPTFGATFRDYGGIDLDYKSLEDGIKLSEWFAQKTRLLNATSFAATALVSAQSMSGMAFYIPACMEDALGPPDDSLEPRFNAAMYIPAVSAWISIAGNHIFNLCRESKTHGFSMDNWELWKKKLGDVALDDSIGDEEREIALKVKDEMTRIQTESGNT